ncbi:DEAD-box ATP-dependent RNA helicase 38-like [Gastrolobium bilobum]|uniref:DEAD-box ATP-dependent RNA helicase 38-like n=1 Tax=Gastrolobium bilobum TaxID=150636 RepID=UPI002AB230A5|nr:DEAD-box ATP-dependent RNA helicase 38-like [Gastrolobium bilobum]
MAEPSTAETTSASDAHPASSSLNVVGLTSDENKKPSPKFLDEPEDSNIQAVSSGDTPYTSATTFEELNLSPELLKGLYVEMKFQKPSKIQAVTLPMILNPPNRDLIVHAHNGSGKTTCFLLGMLSRVDPKLQAPQAFCICPTRELAIQNAIAGGPILPEEKLYPSKGISDQYLGSAVVEPAWLNYFREWGPKTDYSIDDELKKVEKLLPGKLKSAFENFVKSLPKEVLGAEGPTGPKVKNNWSGDEA